MDASKRPSADAPRMNLHPSPQLSWPFCPLSSTGLDHTVLDFRVPDAIWDAAGDCLGILDAFGTIVWLNQAACASWTSQDGPTLLGHSFCDVWDAASRSEAEQALQAARGGLASKFQGVVVSATGSETVWEVHVSAGVGPTLGKAAMLLIARDVTESLKVRSMLGRAARFDGMTGLLNRSAFIQQVNAHLVEQRDMILVLLDVDGLKRANDSDGHLAGNALIEHFAGRLQQIEDNTTIVGRLGGDEFALACLEPLDAEKLERSMRDLCQPTHIEPLTLPYSASAGAAHFAPDRPTFDELYHRADMALYACKGRGGGQHQFFDAALREQLQKSASLISIVSRALAHGDVFPHYQPKISLMTGEVVGFEALLRVRFPDGTVHTAGAVAEALGDARLAVALDRSIFGAVLADMRLWQEHGVSVPVAFNVSNNEVRDAGFAARLLDAMASMGLEPSLFEVEITETVLLDQTDSFVEANLQLLRAAGVRIALDDFGTGYASLSHLKHFPISTIKIDKQFIHDLPCNPGDRAIVEAMVGLGRSLSLEVVAEGVEQQDQMSALQMMACHVGQGYLFAAAVSSAEACAMVRRGRTFSPARAA